MRRSSRISRKRISTSATPAFNQSTEAPFFRPPVQPKLSVNQPGDVYEREADAMAHQVMQMPVHEASTPALPALPASSVSVQRKCAACEEEEHIHRKEAGNTAPATHSPALQQTLQSAGQPMDNPTRSFMEQRFGHDFSGVRIHNDATAHCSSNDIQALAYTHGHHIAFGHGQYNPATHAGKQLLAHELTHTIQQAGAQGPVQRKMQVLKPDDKIPNPTGTGAVQTNGDTVISYLNEICKDANPTLSSGDISIDTSFCNGTTTGADGKPVSKIQQSKTPAGCSCICEMAASSNAFKIVIDDTADPGTHADDLKLARTTGTGATITVRSPNGDSVQTLSKSGNLQTMPPWLVLAHELCGHASFMNKGKSMDDFIGNAVDGRGAHTPTIEIENKIRNEHGIESRGTNRDPCCGGDVDGIFRGTAATNCKDFLKTTKAQDMLKDPGAILFECKKWRDEYNILNGTSFTLEDAVPEKTGETKPAEYRYDIFFNKDMPQTWFNPAASFSVSTTSDGKAAFGEASRIMELRKDIKSVQIEGYASSDKPAGDPDYNTRLAERRVDVVKKELLKKGVDPSLFISFQPTIPCKSCTEIEAGAINCSDTESDPKAANPKDRKVVIRFTKF